MNLALKNKTIMVAASSKELGKSVTGTSVPNSDVSIGIQCSES